VKVNVLNTVMKAKKTTDLAAVEVLPHGPGGHVQLEQELGHVRHLHLLIAVVSKPANRTT
jgi:hypothetical protein